MKQATLGSFLKLELRRANKKGKWLIIGGLAFMFILLTFFGISHYKDIKDESEEFKESERLRVNQMVSYEQYSLAGVRAYFMPSPLLIFFNNSSLFTELTSEVDIAGKINLYSIFKGGKVFSRKSARYFDFSGLILLFGSLLGLLYGYNGFRRHDYLKFLASLYGYRRVYWLTWLSRLILLTAYFISIIMLCSGLVAIMGVSLQFTAVSHFVVFLLTVIILLTLFFSLGSFLGSFKKGGLVGVFAAWFLLVYFFPSLVNKIVEWSSKDIPGYYQSVVEKLKIAKDYEDKALQDFQPLSSAKSDIETKINEFLKLNPDLKNSKNKRKTDHPKFPELEKLQKQKSIIVKRYNDYIDNVTNSFSKRVSPLQEPLEVNIKDEMSSLITNHRIASICIPTSFYLSLNSEMSSGGYYNIMNFYDMAGRMKDSFTDFIVQKFIEGKKGNRFPPKIHGKFNWNENVYYAQSHVPGILFGGFLISFIWIIFIQLLSFNSFRKSIFSKEKVDGMKPIKIDLDNGTSNIVLTLEDKLANHLFNVLSGENDIETGFDGELRREEKSITEGSEKLDFVYLCNPNGVPEDIKVINLALFLGTKGEKNAIKARFSNENGKKYFNDLKEEDRNRIFFDIVRKQFNEVKIYYLNDYVKGMPPYITQKFVKDIKRMKEGGTAILYVTNNIIFARRIADFVVFRDEDKELATIV